MGQIGVDFQTPQNGFCYLSGAGKPMVIDGIMLAGLVMFASEGSERILKVS
ncbi:MAG: hypothetical protein Q8K04_10500 [Lutibacter sp.]|jgi:uncharacterized membrane protein YkgB|nr:hypothetical protein [Lutibacter sp.]